MKKIFASLSVILLLCCCQKNDPEPLMVLSAFELTVDGDYGEEGADHWVIIHDEDGQPIADGQFTPGSSLRFDSLMIEEGHTLGITLLDVHFFNGVPSFIATSFLNVDDGTNWHLSERKGFSSPSSYGKHLGSVTVHVKDVLFGPTFESQISNKYVARTPEIYQTTSSSFKLKPHDLYDSLDDYFLFVVDNQNIPKYRFLKDLEPGDKKMSFHELKNFDEIVNVKFPATACSGLSIQAYEDEQLPEEDKGYYINYYYNTSLQLAERTSFNAAYLARFKKYRTKVFARYGNHAYHYHKLGGIPDKIEFPLKVSFQLVDQSFTNFTYSAQDTFVRRSSHWFFSGELNGQSLSLSWEVQSPDSTTAKNLAYLPNTILQRYPYLDIGNLEHQKTTFHTTGYSYERFLHKSFDSDVVFEDFVDVAVEVY